MKQMNLPKMSTVKPPKQKPSAEEVGVCTNLLAQQFNQPAPNLVWVCDFTYVRVGTRFFYLCVILDLYARKVIACRVGKRIDRFLAIDTLRDAVRRRGVSKGVMFHTDRGSQFTSSDFRKEIDSLHMIQSFSAKGHPYDNAVMECFFKYLKKEELIWFPILLDFITQSDLTLIAMVFLPIKWKTAISLISLVHFIDYSPAELEEENLILKKAIAIFTPHSDRD